MSHESVLIVEDNLTNLKLVKLILIIEGYEVRTATDAREALEVLKDFHPQLILMDLQLPGMDGLELTRRLKEDPVFKGTKIIALTAYAMKGDEEKALNAGCDGYITKPIDTQTFPILIASYFAKKPEKKVD